MTRINKYDVPKLLRNPYWALPLKDPGSTIVYIMARIVAICGTLKGIYHKSYYNNGADSEREQQFNEKSTFTPMQAQQF